MPKKISRKQAELLFKQYRPMAWHVAKRVRLQLQTKDNTPVPNTVLIAEDVLTDVLMAWVTRGQNRPELSPSTYIYAVLSRKVGRLAVQEINLANRARQITANYSRTEKPIDRLTRELGDDARTVMATITDAPAEITKDVQAAIFSNRRTDRGQGKGRAWRTKQAIKNHLIGMGWDPDRVRAAWNEVAQAV